ncbi:MAG: BatA and WFA domain-containing protein, partial [Candidatus Tectomicrobia bacterium]|nr:BatA and WFA domain-containing protein [Candidatus Tectomicrobia bacterium]
MTWLNPAAFAFLLSIPIIIALHSLRYRRRDVQVSTLFLWEQVMREAHGSLGLRRLVQNLPLLLQLLLALLLTAALANPALTQSVAQSKDIILVLDISASMQTRTPQGTRFDTARRHALEVLGTLPSGRQMAVIAAGRQPRVVTFFTDETALLRQAITALQPTEAPGNMREAILLALSFTQGRKSQEVVVIGDGAYRRLDDL